MDTLERLGIARHFRVEIQNVLDEKVQHLESSSFQSGSSLIALEKAVKAAMVPAGTARADFGREVLAFDVDATAVELEFHKLYSYLFDFENMGYNAEEANRPMPATIFIVNFDKVGFSILHFLSSSTTFVTYLRFLLGYCIHISKWF
ncbi:capsid protein [Tanacetum coccineum]